MAAVGFPIAFAIAPGDIGPAFARLGVPYKFAYGLELTFRFVPSLAADCRPRSTRSGVRGYEWEQARTGPVGQLTPDDPASHAA